MYIVDMTGQHHLSFGGETASLTEEGARTMLLPHMELENLGALHHISARGTGYGEAGIHVIPLHVGIQSLAGLEALSTHFTRDNPIRTGMSLMNVLPKAILAHECFITLVAFVTVEFWVRREDMGLSLLVGTKTLATSVTRLGTFVVPELVVHEGQRMGKHAWT